MKSQLVKTCSNLSGKTKETKEKPEFFAVNERLWTNWHMIKIEIKWTTSCSNLAAKAREPENGCFLCLCCQPWTSHGYFVVSLVKLFKKTKIILEIICMIPVELE